MLKQHESETINQASKLQIQSDLFLSCFGRIWSSFILTCVLMILVFCIPNGAASLPPHRSNGGEQWRRRATPTAAHREQSQLYLWESWENQNWDLGLADSNSQLKHAHGPSPLDLTSPQKKQPFPKHWWYARDGALAGSSQQALCSRPWSSLQSPISTDTQLLKFCLATKCNMPCRYHANAVKL